MAAKKIASEKQRQHQWRRQRENKHEAKKLARTLLCNSGGENSIMAKTYRERKSNRSSGNVAKKKISATYNHISRKASAAKNSNRNQRRIS